MEELWTALDNRDAVEPKNIPGAGKIYQDTYWLDIGDRFVCMLFTQILVQEPNSSGLMKALDQETRGLRVMQHSVSMNG